MDLPKYPKIEWYSKSTPFKPCIAFEKYDGSNLSWHWNRELGFQDFFTRRRKFDTSDPDFGVAIPIFESYSDELSKVFQQDPFTKSSDIVIYVEYFGNLSFGGIHSSQDSMKIMILDVWANNLGFLGPNEFLVAFRGLPIPKVIYKGKITGKFSEDVKLGNYPVEEGVVCKGGKTGDVWMCKIKTQKWLDKLQKSFTEPRWTATDGIERDLDEETQKG